MSESVTPNPDYREDTDIVRVHSSVKREKTTALTTGNEPASLWVFLACGMVLLLGGGYLGAYSGGFRASQTDPHDSQALIADRRPGLDTGAVEEDPFTLAMNRGALVYANCAGCHQASGVGVAGAIPPLADSEWVTGSTERLAAIILRGLQGPITVRGTTYNSVMAGNPNLTDADVAAVMTYIRNSWGNEGSMVTREMVAHARELYEDVPIMTEAMLLEIPEDQDLPGADPVEPDPGDNDSDEGGDLPGADPVEPEQEGAEHDGNLPDAA